MTDSWKCPRCGATSPRAGGIERAIDRQTAMQRQGIALIAELLGYQALLTGGMSEPKTAEIVRIMDEIEAFKKER